MEKRYQEYEKLAEKAQMIADSIPPALRDAYFQLVLYPVLGAKLMNGKILSAKRSFLQASKDDAKNVIRYHDEIKRITATYNHTISKGKWDGMMDWKPRNQAVFNIPVTAETVSNEKRDSVRNLYASVKTPQFIVEAYSFTTHKQTRQTRVLIVPGLGINGNGVSVFNNQSMPFTAFDSAYIEFDLPDSKAGTYTVVVKCLPTFDVDRSKNLRYAISINNENPNTINVHAEADSKDWRENVIRGYSAGRSTHKLTGKNDKLRLDFKDYHLVINTIEFYRN